MMTNEQLFNAYHDTRLTQALRDCHLETLRKRASYGYTDAKKYVNKIERGLCAM